jgi:hypothetical protein
MATPSSGIWTYRETILVQAQPDLAGYKVEAEDGSIGKVDEASNEIGSAFVVVDTGPWIFGTKVMIPAGAVRDIDPDAETVFVDRTKDEIKDAPEFDENRLSDPAYRQELGRYYADPQ